MRKIFALLLAIAATVSVLAGVEGRRARAANGDTARAPDALDSAYSPDRQVQAFRSALAVVDTLTTTNVLSLPVFQTGNRTTICLQGRFTNSAATCQVQLAYVYKLPQATSNTDVTTYSVTIPNSAGTGTTTVSVAGNKITHWSEVFTLTASSTQKEGSYYESQRLYLDTDRAVTIRILVVGAPSAGTVDFWPGS